MVCVGKRKYNWGFTLIELLAVVVIIGILAVTVIPIFQNAQIRARIARAHADEKALAVALEAYQIDHQRYLPYLLTRHWGDYNPAFHSLHRLLPITTPIAFIAGLPPDVFMSTGFAPSLDYDTYTYYDRASISGDSWKYQFSVRETHQYVLRCLGPDHTPNLIFGLQDNGFILPYSVTNGLYSFGDITYYGP